MEKLSLPGDIKWDQVKLLELDKSQICLVLADGAKVALPYSSSDDLQHILNKFPQPRG
ncbi:MAG: hypothetical protein ACO1QB_05645 [Verrucomicrobiales bacterium]